MTNTYIALAESNFKSQQVTIDFTGSMIVRQLIDEGKVTWAELSFTETDLAQAEHQTRIRILERYFRLLKTAQYMRANVSMYVTNIRRQRREFNIPWTKLSFTDTDLAVLLQDQKQAA